ncbi:MAG: acetamidase/formamidase family protein [Tissierellia bacterium]|nr:acetamidase/formamidase family protein [Tissierellia bacterium]
MKTLSRGKCIYEMKSDNEPVIKIDEGEKLLVETYDCFTGALKSEDIKISEISWDEINPATGPIFVNGAEPGDILVVNIEKINLVGDAVMTTAPGLGVLGDYIEDQTTTILKIEGDKLIFNENIRIPIRPMIGVIGTAPREGSVLCGTPDEHGGNMDCKEIIEGISLYLPVFHEGALLSLGDLHAVMADGEVCICGAEIDGEVIISCEIIKGGMKNYPYPMIVGPEKVMIIDSKKTLEEAVDSAVLKARNYLVEHKGLNEEEAIRYLSLAGDVRICQVVDPLMTVRVELNSEL